jgi:type VI secretion system Hcp family effector
MFSIYLHVKGDKSGVFEGSSVNKGHEKWIEVLGYNQGLTAPIDTNSLRGSGRAVLSPMRIRKPIDASTPVIYQAAFMHENLPEVKVEFYTAGATGVGVKYLEVILKDAYISKSEINFAPELGGREQTNVHDHNTQVVEFVFEKISWSASSFDRKGIKILGPKTTEVNVKDL